MKKKEVELEHKEYNKMTSRRFWIVVWSMLMITLISVGSFIRNNYELTGVSMALVSVVTAYIGIETWNKKYKYEGTE